jgi:transposase InsO family protein
MPFKILYFVARAFTKTNRHLVWENAILRYQITVARRNEKRVILRRWDRAILLWLSKKIPDLRKSLLIVQPETLVRWHRKGFRLYWGWKYSRKSGRPAIHSTTIHLIRKISKSNPLWGAPRIHGELLKLGVSVSQATVEKYMYRNFRGPKPQNWKSFLRNHTKEVVAIDFMIVPTIKLKMLWVLVILSHDRRRILRLSVTHNPSTRWTAQQLRECYPFQEFPKIILRDRDRNFKDLSKFGFKERITSHRSPWQNAYVERVIGSIRRECTDHLVVFSERHLTRILLQYQQYYNVNAS